VGFSRKDQVKPKSRKHKTDAAIASEQKNPLKKPEKGGELRKDPGTPGVALWSTVAELARKGLTGLGNGEGR